MHIGWVILWSSLFLLGILVSIGSIGIGGVILSGTFSGKIYTKCNCTSYYYNSSGSSSSNVSTIYKEKYYSIIVSLGNYTCNNTIECNYPKKNPSKISVCTDEDDFYCNFDKDKLAGIIPIFVGIIVICIIVLLFIVTFEYIYKPDIQWCCNCNVAYTKTKKGYASM